MKKYFKNQILKNTRKEKIVKFAAKYGKLESIATCLEANLEHQKMQSWGYHCMMFVTDNRLEGWLSVPNKQNIKRHGWRRQYVVVSSRKIIFYNSENDKQNSDPILILDLT